MYAIRNCMGSAGNAYPISVASWSWPGAAKKRQREAIWSEKLFLELFLIYRALLGWRLLADTSNVDRTRATTERPLRETKRMNFIASVWQAGAELFLSLPLSWAHSQSLRSTDPGCFGIAIWAFIIWRSTGKLLRPCNFAIRNSILGVLS